MNDRRNYWIKLNEHFFDDPRIEYMLSLKGGELAVIVYQKLLLRGMNTGGQVFFFNERKCDEKFIASALAITVGKLQKSIEILQDMELLELNEDGSYFLPEIEKMVGGESASAARMRRKRAQEASQQASQKGEQCAQESDTDKDKEKDKEIEIESDTDSDTDTDTDRLPGPSFGELLAICRAGKYRVDIKEFMDHYRAMNWTKGGVPITDWNTQLRLWDYSKRFKSRQDGGMSGFG